MYLTPNRFKSYPYTVVATGFGWGVLDRTVDPPYIRGEESDTEEEAQSIAEPLNEQHWLAEEAKSQAYWAIRAAEESSRSPVSSSSLWTRLKALLRRWQFS